MLMCSRVDGSVRATHGALICTPPKSEEPRLLDGSAAGASVGLMLSVRLGGALLHLEQSSGALTGITLVNSGPFPPPGPGAEITLGCRRCWRHPLTGVTEQKGRPTHSFLFYKL